MSSYLDEIEGQLVELTERGTRRAARLSSFRPAPRRVGESLAFAAMLTVSLGVVAVLLSAHTAPRRVTSGTRPARHRQITTQPVRPAKPRTCRTDELHLIRGVYLQAMNQFSQTLVLTNTSSISCTLIGYPRLTFPGLARILVLHGRGYTANDPGPKLVVLRPGGLASFAMNGLASDVVYNQSCQRAREVDVTPPRTSGTLTIAVNIAACREGFYVTAVGAGSNSAKL